MVVVVANVHIPEKVNKLLVSGRKATLGVRLRGSSNGV